MSFVIVDPEMLAAAATDVESIGSALRAANAAAAAQTTVTISGEVNVLIVGVLLVLFVVLAPEGVLGLFKRWLKPSSR